MNTAKLILRGSLLRVTETLISMAIGLFMLPFLLHHLGNEQYGLWILVGGITGSLYLFDLGFASSVTRFVASAIGAKDYGRANSVISSALIIYTALGIVIALVITIAFFFIHASPEPGQDVFTFRLLILIVGITIASEFPFKALAGVAISQMRYDLMSIGRISIKALSTVATIYYVKTGSGVISVAVIFAISGLFSNVIFYYITRHSFPQLAPSLALVNKVLLKDMARFSLWSFSLDINRMVKNRGDLLIIGLYIAPTAIATYYVSLRLADYMDEIFFKLANISMPLLSQYYGKKNLSEFYEKLILFTRANIALSGISLALSYYLANHFIHIWMGRSFDTRTAYICFIILLAGRLASLSSSAFAAMLMATNNHKYTALISFAETSASFLLIFALINFFNKEIIYVAIAIAFPLVLSRLLILPIVASNICNVDFGKVLRAVAPIFIGYSILCGISVMLSICFPINNVTSFVLGAVVMSCLSLLPGFILLNSKELQHIENALPSAILCFTPVKFAISLKRKLLLSL